MASPEAWPGTARPEDCGVDLAYPDHVRTTEGYRRRE
jgi:hypothetical protein